jgi:hypothetical protein
MQLADRQHGAFFLTRTCEDKQEKIKESKEGQVAVNSDFRYLKFMAQ